MTQSTEKSLYGLVPCINSKWIKGLFSPRLEKQGAELVTLLWSSAFGYQGYHSVLSVNENNVKYLKKLYGQLAPVMRFQVSFWREV